MRARGVSVPTEVVIVRDRPGQPVLTKARPVNPLWAYRKWRRFDAGRLPMTDNQRMAAEILAQTMYDHPARMPYVAPSPLLSEYTTVFTRRAVSRGRQPWTAGV